MRLNTLAQPSTVWVAVLFTLLAALWFVNFGERKLNRPDEGRYAEIAREMALSADYVTPRLNDLKYFEKPPLHYWASALAIKVLGINESSARLWSVLSGFLALCFTFFAVNLLANRAQAAATLSIMAASLWYFGMGHINNLDMGLTASLTAALLCFLLSQRRDIGQRVETQWLLAAWAFAGLAFLSKGLVGLLIPAASVGLYCLFAWDWALLKRLRWLPGLFVFLLITLPWMLLAQSRNDEFFDFFIVHEHFKRFLSSEHQREGAWHYFIPLILVGALPWTLYLVNLLRGGAQQLIAQSFNSRLKVNRLLSIWCVFTFCFFSISKSKLPSYILPILPVLALLLAPVLLHLSRSAWRLGLLSLVPLITVLLAYPWVFPKLATEFYTVAYIAPLAQGLSVAGTIFLLCLLIGWFISNRLTAIASVSVLFLLGFHAILWQYQALHPLFSGFDAAQKIKTLTAQTPKAPLYSIDMYDQTLTYYLQRPVTLVDYVDEFKLGQTAEPQKSIAKLADFIPIWQAHPQAFAIINDKSLGELYLQKIPYTLHLKNERFNVISRQ
jgi:4-amino-4-deoxy-L-arabinose transferase-like glycosyltransferase